MGDVTGKELLATTVSLCAYGLDYSFARNIYMQAVPIHITGNKTIDLLLFCFIDII